MANSGYWSVLFHAGRKAWALAFWEMIVITGISLLPLLAGALRDALPTNSTIDFGASLHKAFFSGQLIFYSVGLIATVLWHSNKDFQKFFSWRLTFNIYCLIGLGLCILMIGYDPTLSAVKPDILVPSSIFLFISSAFFYTIITVIAHVDVNLGRSTAEADAALGQEVRRSRGLS